VRIPVGDLVFDVLVAGPEEGRPVLLLHGFPENARMWDGVVPRLHAAGLRTVAPDQRGYSPGARPEDPSAYAMADLAGDALGLLDALGLSTVDVVGHDWGAVVGWNLAARHPGRVRTLTAVSVPHPAAHGWALRNDERQRTLSAYIQLFRIPGKAEEVLLAEDARRLRRMLTPLSDGQAEVFVRPLTEPGALTGALNWYRGMSGRDIAGLGPVTVPTTYVWGTEDLGVARAAAERNADHVAGDYRFVPLEGVSHWVPEELPDVVADEALRRILG
jgi:pimeloyl-ACP methyl ester carboxylesterase